MNLLFQEISDARSFKIDVSYLPVMLSAGKTTLFSHFLQEKLHFSPTTLQTA